MPYLLKTEPDVYSYADLQREKETVWDGVANFQALKYLAGMKRGDALVIYHSTGERTAVGTAKVVSVEAEDPRNPVVRIHVGKPLASPRTLADIKATALFSTSPIVRQARLSVVPLTDEQWQWFIG